MTTLPSDKPKPTYLRTEGKDSRSQVLYEVRALDGYRLVYSSYIAENANMWIWANEFGLPHINQYGEVFCLCGNHAAEYGFARAYEDGTTVPDDEDDYPGWLRCSNDSCGIVFDGSTGVPIIRDGAQ